MIKLKEVIYRTGNIEIPSVQFHDGEITGLFGIPESGKTSFIEMLGNQKKYSGSILINGTEKRDINRKIFFQTVNYSSMAAERVNGESRLKDAVLRGRRAYRKTLSPYSSMDAETAEKYIEEFGLKNHTQSKIKTLSTSMRQCVMLAKAFASETSILLLDNPESFLNPLQKTRLSAALKKYVLNGKRTVIISSNNLDFLSLNCDRLILMDRGKFKIDGTPDMLTEKMMKEVFNIDTLISKNIVTGRPQIQIVENI